MTTMTADSTGTASPAAASTGPAGPGSGRTGAGGTDPSGRLAGMALMFGSGLSCQFGAATATMAFPVLGPAGVVAIRQWVAGAVLLTVGRPRLRSFTWPQWWPVLLLAVVFATMNLSLYVAIDRVGLGLAVALEFLGPLAVALAASRRFLDLACALAAGAAVAVVARPQPTTDYLGIGLGLLAATCWACYILLNKIIGRRVPGAQGPAAAAGISAVLYVPIGIWVLSTHPVTLRALGFAATAGVLSSAVPFLGDVLALRRVPTGFFGVFMSVNPVLAAFIGLLVLGQQLQWEEWLAIVVIVTANAVSAGTAARAGTLPAAGPRARRRLRRPARAARPVPARTASAVPAAQSAAAVRVSAGSTAARPRPRGH
jgi:inner membrane transporter RhtA